jgi:hypothetical protein
MVVTSPAPPSPPLGVVGCSSVLCLFAGGASFDDEEEEDEEEDEEEEEESEEDWAFLVAAALALGLELDDDDDDDDDEDDGEVAFLAAGLAAAGLEAFFFCAVEDEDELDELDDDDILGFVKKNDEFAKTDKKTEIPFSKTKRNKKKKKSKKKKKIKHKKKNQTKKKTKKPKKKKKKKIQTQNTQCAPFPCLRSCCPLSHFPFAGLARNTVLT